jgi:hypothetical protein
VRFGTLADRSFTTARTRRSISAAALALGLGLTGVVSAAPADAHSSTSLKSELHRLRICESGNNYRLHTGNGYFGAYQFSRSTWQGLGFRGRPDRAPRHRQDRAAKTLHARSGWGAWPSCSQREHLR